MNIRSLIESKGLKMGRTISAYKKLPEGHLGWFNASFLDGTGKLIWFGDIDITKSGDILQEIVNSTGESLYILRESDCFRYGDDISKAIHIINPK